MKATESTTNRPESKARGIIRLIGLVALVIVFILIIAPYMDRAPLVQPLIQFIDERDIDAGALFYTDIEEFSDAANFMDNTMEFAPEMNLHEDTFSDLHGWF